MTPAFNFKQTEFSLKDLNNALALAQMSALAYRDKGTVERELATNNC